MTIKFRIRNVEAVQSFLRAMPRGAIRVAIKAFTEYVLGNERHGLRHAEPYKVVTRKSAYGFSFFTDKQRRWFFWALRNNKINPGVNNRTGKSTAAWMAVPRNNGYVYTIKNDTPGGYWTRHNTRQARQLGKVGWRKISAVIAANYLGGMRAAIAAVKEYLAKKK